MRQPYGRRIASTVTYAHPSWYAANGFIVVIQDVRGRGTSEGSFRLFVDDVRDGGDAITWAARLPGSTGRLGMYGFSYQGHTQFLALAAGRPELQALCPAMATWDVRTDWAYEGSAFCFLLSLGWGIQMAAEQARLAGDSEAFDALIAAAWALPLHSPRPCRPEVLEAFGHYSHYGDWVKNKDPGPYWEEIAVGRALEGKPMNVPMLHIGGSGRPCRHSFRGWRLFGLYDEAGVTLITDARCRIDHRIDERPVGNRVRTISIFSVKMLGCAIARASRWSRVKAIGPDSSCSRTIRFTASPSCVRSP
jgi:putative CocE/NonD family hydrolase